MATKNQSLFRSVRHHSISLALVAMAASATFIAAPTEAGPVNPSVQRGNVTITQNGDNFIITAGR